MSAKLDVKPLPKGMLAVGVPLRHSVYDMQGKLLLQAGFVVESDHQIEQLYQRGLYLNSNDLGNVQKSSKAGNTTKDEEPDVTNYTSIIELKSNMMKVGDNIQIKPLAENQENVQYFVKYLGGLDKKSLICTLPMEGDKVVFIKENSAFSVRLFSGKNVYVFNSIVEIVYSRPYPHLHFKFPKQVHINKLRRNQRVDVAIIGLLTNSSDPADVIKAPGRIDNISMRGALFNSKREAGNVGETVEISFKVKMGWGEALFVIPSIIRSVNQNRLQGGEREYLYGVEFTDIAFQEKALLQNYIFQCITGENIDDI